MTDDVLQLKPGDDTRMMQTPDLWPLGPVLCLKREFDGGGPRDDDTGLIVLHPDINRLEVFLLNVYDDRLRQLLAGDKTGIDSIIYSSFQQIVDEGWVVD